MAMENQQLSEHVMKQSGENDAAKTRYGSPEETEKAFYEAFAQCDLQAMGEVWANSDVMCIHPGSTALKGREAVMRSWAEIFGGASKPSVRVKAISKAIYGNLAVHVVEEYITPGDGPDKSPSMVLATNIFLLHEDAWQMIEHHASLPMVDLDKNQQKSALH
jgi:ketosteroid isomerase-like protein